MGSSTPTTDASAIEGRNFPLAGKRVWVAGHRGMVGSAIVRRLSRIDCEVLTAPRAEVDLTRQAETEAWIAAKRPDAIFLAAARVGGIHANNSRPAEFLYENLAIQTNVIHAAHKAGVGKLLFLGSSCIYPKFAKQPIAEAELLQGALEPTNEWYAIAKIAGLKMCAAYRKQYGSRFISAMPTNLYGAGDNYDLEQSHVVGALLVKTHRAKVARQPTIEIWGTGTPRREFLFVDDLADACVFLMENYEQEQTINVGVGSDVTILELAETIARVVGWQGRYVLNAAKPDGTPRKLLDVSRLAGLGWRAKTPLEDGLRQAYEWYVANAAEAAA
jgi:GDP-L-fucose synthase